MKKNILRFLPLNFAVFALWLGITMEVSASSTHSSTKSCSLSPCSTTGTGSFTISTPQTVRWRATRAGGGGNDFYLSTSGPNMADIPITTSLGSGFSSGEFFLNPGNYFIAINTANMGPGSYSIEYDLIADCNVSPLSHAFGSHDVGSSGADRTFTISLAGDMEDVSIGSISGTDNVHFVVSGATGTTLESSGPTSVSFTVHFEPGITPGIFSSTITIVTTNPSLSVPDKTITVTGTTVPLEPDINCVNSGSFDLDYLVSASGTFNKSFRNEGNAPLVISSIVLGANPSEVFALDGVPSTTNLADGATRPVSIRFTPPAMEQTYTGSIIINSNSPGETIKECFFTARAHHPEPNMVVSVVPDGGTTADYREVEVGFTFTKGIKVSNIGDAPLLLSLNLIDPEDDDLLQWSEINEPNNVTIAAGDDQIFLQRFSPENVGTYTFQIEAVGTGGSGTYNSTDVVTLTGNGINPIPMDNVLVLDRSGSMADPAGSRTKIDAMQKAARLYYDLLRPDPGDGTGDQIGMIKYNSSADNYFTPLQFKNSANDPIVLDLLSEAATTDPSRLEPSGGTCISCGMTDGASLLLASPDTRKQVMVVMTDGLETAGPGVSTVLGSITSTNPDLKMYSLGLGNTFDAPLLQSITNVGDGGYHQVSEDLLGTNHFALEEFYFKIYSNASSFDLVVDPTEAIDLSSGNPIEVNRAKIVSSDKFAVFMVLDDPQLSGYYKLEFIDPNGTILDPTSSVGGIPIQTLKRNGYTIYKIIFPDISLSHTYVGDWVLRLNPTGKWKPPIKGANHENYNISGEWIQPYQGTVPIGFGAAVKSDYNMNVAVSSNHFHPGATILLTAQLSDRGWPSIGGHIELTATKPDATATNFLLYDDGTHGDTEANDGTYTNIYNQTALQGSYRFFFNGRGKNERGELVPRQATRFVSLFAIPNDGNGETSCLSCWISWVKLLLLLLILSTLIYCCRRQFK